MTQEKYYTIGKIKPLDQADILAIEKGLNQKLPTAYRDFLMTYGYGDFNELVTICAPDKDRFKLQFGQHLYFWHLPPEKVNAIRQGVTVAYTIDGDMVLWTQEALNPWVIMPRHDREPIYFQHFNQVIQYYIAFFNLNNHLLFFDSHYQLQVHAFISFIKDKKCDHACFYKVYNQFKELIPYDRIIAHEQPYFVMQKMGGWVFFDLINKNSIRVKYQQPFLEEAHQMIEWIESQIQNQGQ